MRSSLKRSTALALGVALAAGIGATLYNLSKFYQYENKVVRVMSGDQKSVLLGRLLQARVKATQELVQTSVESEEANEQFKKRLQSLADDLKTLSRDESDKTIEEAKTSIASMIEAKAEPVEDLFVHYRNLKTTAFNLYRQAWANKWMGVAKQLGLIVNDLDNLPYQSADRAATSVNAKSQQLVGYITRSALAQGQKLHLFGQLAGLRTLVTKYNEALTRADALKAKRLETLKGIEAKLEKYNGIQGKGLMQFGNEAHSEVLKALIASMLLILFAIGWYVLSLKRLAERFRAVAFVISRQMAAWVTNGGGIAAQGFKPPAKPDAEFAETYQILDQTIKRVNGLRKEDILVKRLLNVPFLLVSRQKQATFWNSALSILAKVRALEETGPLAYRNLLRFTDGQGRAIDPVERAFAETKECTQLALLRIGNDGIAVHVVCTPVMGADNQPEYVMVHLRDLREENKRFEIELEKQLEIVRAAVHEIKAGKAPSSGAGGMRKPVAECVHLLKAFSLELQEKASTLAGQLETMTSRMEREAGLKKNVHGRLEQIKEEVTGLRGQLDTIRSQAHGVAGRLGEIEQRGKLLRGDYSEIRRRGSALMSDAKASQDLVTQALSFLENAEDVSKRVRSNERVIRAILEKSAMLNANNSILSTKRELSPSEVATVTENIAQLLGQFERSYRFIEQSVAEIEASTAEITERLKSALSSAINLSKQEQAIIKAVYDSERAVDDGSRDVSEFGTEIAALNAASQRIGQQMAAVEGKIQTLVQIGKASLDLQQQLENGFKGIKSQTLGETSAVDPRARLLSQ